MFKKENRFKVSLRLLSLIVVCALLMAVFEPVAIAEDKSIDSESKPMMIFLYTCAGMEL